MIVVVMRQHGLDLQGAVDFVGNMCKQSIDRFEADHKLLPSWGPKVDEEVQRYVEGLQDWIVGSLHWSFDTTRYFGQEGAAIKANRIVQLSCPRNPDLTSAESSRVVAEDGYVCSPSTTLNLLIVAMWSRVVTGLPEA